jgi:hypothetical protein
MVFGGNLQEIFNRQGILRYQENFIDPPERQAALFESLKSTLHWRQDQIRLFGKTHAGSKAYRPGMETPRHAIATQGSL